MVTYCMSRVAGIIFYVAYFFFSVLFGILQTLQPSLSPGMIYLSSLLPYLQIQNVARLALLANNTGQQMHLGDLTTPIQGVKPSKVYTIGAIITVLLLTIVIYIWPLKINVDRERKLRFYYPFTCSYWRHDEDEELPERELLIDHPSQLAEL